jgi:hypothetical protein
LVSSFMRSWNDTLDDEDRQQLKPLIPALIGTVKGDAVDQARGWMCVDWLIRVHTPAWLDLAGCTDAALRLRERDQTIDMASLDAAATAIAFARKAGAAAWAAARAAAWDAAGVAAGDAAWDAARDAAGDAAWDAAGDAAGAAAWAATWDAAWDAARDATWAATWDAARAAARDAAKAAARDAAGVAAGDAAGAAAWAAARDAAGDAARAALRPTVVELQASAVELVERMCAL